MLERNTYLKYLKTKLIWMIIFLNISLINIKKCYPKLWRQ